jgi:cytoskeletal protein RodZ
MEESPRKPGDASPKRKRLPGGSLLYVAALIVGIVAAWLVHEHVAASRPRPPAAARGYAPASPTSVRLSAPRELATQLADTEALSVWAGDPLGIVPHPAARRLRGFERTAHGVTQQQATYSLPAEAADQAWEQYLFKLDEAGYRRQALPAATSPTAPAAGRLAVLAGPQGVVQVALRRMGADAKIVQLDITVTLRGAQ